MEMPLLRPWLFRIAHNRALDLLRGRSLRRTEPIEAAADIADAASPDPVETLMRQEAVKTAVSRFAELPTMQRSVVILKDVLDEQLSEIATLLDLTVDAVKAHLARGRARLRTINAQARSFPAAQPASAAVARYAALFNQRDWDGLRALLASDVKLKQVLVFRSRGGSADVGMFFGIYSKLDPVWLVPAWLEGREVNCRVRETSAAAQPNYFMWLEWRDARSASSATTSMSATSRPNAELTLAPEDWAGGRGRCALMALRPRSTRHASRRRCWCARCSGIELRQIKIRQQAFAAASRTGEIARCMLSTSLAFRYCRIVAGRRRSSRRAFRQLAARAAKLRESRPSRSEKSCPFHLDRWSRVVGEHVHWRVIGRVVAPPALPRIIRPGAARGPNMLRPRIQAPIPSMPRAARSSSIPVIPLPPPNIA